MDVEAMCSLKTSVSFLLYTLCHVLEKQSIFSTDNVTNYITVPIVIYISWDLELEYTKTNTFQ